MFPCFLFKWTKTEKFSNFHLNLSSRCNLRIQIIYLDEKQCCKRKVVSFGINVTLDFKRFWYLEQIASNTRKFDSINILKHQRTYLIYFFLHRTNYKVIDALFFKRRDLVEQDPSKVLAQHNMFDSHLSLILKYSPINSWSIFSW